MEPSPDLQYAADIDRQPIPFCSSSSSSSSSSFPLPLSLIPASKSSSPSPNSAIIQHTEKGCCNCPIKVKIASLQNATDWRVDEIIKIPSSARGYLDSQTGKQDEYSVRRRYSDFEFLAAHFNRAYPFVVIPPIPPKKSLNLSISGVFGSTASNNGLASGAGSFYSNDSNSVVDHRIRAFHSFLCHVIANRTLSADHIFHLFISDPETTFWRNQVFQYELKELPKTTAVAAPAKAPKSLPKTIADVYNSLTALEESVKSAENSQKLVLRKQQDILKAMEAIGTAFNGFSLEYSQIATQLDIIGEFYDGNAATFVDVTMTQQRICELIYEMRQFVLAIKRPILNLIGKQLEYDAVSSHLNQLKSQSLQKSDQLSLDLRTLEIEESQSSVELYSICDLLAEQLKGWIDRLYLAWSSLLLQTSSAHKQFAEQGIHRWRNVEIDNS